MTDTSKGGSSWQMSDADPQRSEALAEVKKVTSIQHRLAAGTISPSGEEVAWLKSVTIAGDDREASRGSEWVYQGQFANASSSFSETTAGRQILWIGGPRC